MIAAFWIGYVALLSLALAYAPLQTLLTCLCTGALLVVMFFRTDCAEVANG